MPSKQIIKNKVLQPVEKELEGPQDKQWFPRIPCDACGKHIGTVNLTDKKYLCFLCYETVKTKGGFKFEQFEKLELKQALEQLKEKPAGSRQIKKE